MYNYHTIFINGQPFNCSKDMSLHEILLYLNFNTKNIIIEYNHEIIDMNRLHDFFLLDKDKIEVITIVGGG
uniref:Thiamin biosynthesis protein S n=1 Tax=Bornetia secundiflora TaxID=2575637 RepID=A0A4D6WMH0_9FLOR|nr:Thiamin biosynthesis protein S [Bornetia secundiflora]